jgi:hypothetical protein
MKSKTGWILAIVIALVLLLVLPGLFMMGRLWGGGYGGMMGGGYGLMHPFGLGGMFLGWLIPAGILVLLVVGGVWLVNNLTKKGNSQSNISANLNCPNCGKPAQAEWSTCPYCGKLLK